MSTPNVDLRNIDHDGEITVQTKSGETFTGQVVGYEQQECDDYRKGWVHIDIEGGLWDQVKNRVDSETLRAEQKFTRRSGNPQMASVYGTKWIDGEPEYVKLGTIDAIE